MNVEKDPLFFYLIMLRIVSIEKRAENDRKRFACCYLLSRGSRHSAVSTTSPFAADSYKHPFLMACRHANKA